RLRSPVALGIGHHLDGPFLDPRIGCTSHDLLLCIYGPGSVWHRGGCRYEVQITLFVRGFGIYGLEGPGRDQSHASLAERPDVRGNRLLISGRKPTIGSRGILCRSASPRRPEDSAFAVAYFDRERAMMLRWISEEPS